MSLRRNVKEQNDFQLAGMLAVASHFRDNGVAPGVDHFFVSHGIDLNSSAIVFAQTQSYMLSFESGLGGLLVTRDHLFYEFELELTPDLSVVSKVHEFTDVTHKQNTSVKNRATGKGYGALALEVLQMINKPTRKVRS
jgi:hypothetical protein